MTYARVLIATDLSLPARHAARLASHLGGPDARYRVVTVERLPGPLDGARTALSRTKTAAPDAREELLAWCKSAGLDDAEAIVVRGRVATEVARQAESFRADLVVVGSRGQNRVARLLLGSVARSVLRHATTDVLVARGEPPAASRRRRALRRIVVATDFESPAAVAATRAAQLAKEQGASLSLVHAIDPDVLRSAVKGARPAKGKEDEKWLRKTLAEMLASFDSEHLGGAAKEEILVGSPASAIAKHAGDIEADLVVIGTHGAGRLERALIGSGAEAIAERAPCSVLVVRG